MGISNIRKAESVTVEHNVNALIVKIVLMKDTAPALFGPYARHNWLQEAHVHEQGKHIIVMAKFQSMKAMPMMIPLRFIMIFWLVYKDLNGWLRFQIASSQFTSWSLDQYYSTNNQTRSSSSSIFSYHHVFLRPVLGFPCQRCYL